MSVYTHPAAKAAITAFSSDGALTGLDLQFLEEVLPLIQCLDPRVEYKILDEDMEEDDANLLPFFDEINLVTKIMSERFLARETDEGYTVYLLNVPGTRTHNGVKFWYNFDGGSSAPAYIVPVDYDRHQPAC